MNLVVKGSQQPHISEKLCEKPMPYSGICILEILEGAENYNQYLASLIENRRKLDSSLLDFGAGVGTFALPLLRQGVDIICIEPDPELGERLRKAGAKVAAELSDICDESLDLIYTFNVLEHIPDDDVTLQQLANKLKPSGVLLIYVPSFMILYSSFDKNIGHLRRYRRRGLVNLVSAAGLQVIDAHYVDCIGFCVTLLFRAFRLKQNTINQGTIRFYDKILFPISCIFDAILRNRLGKNLIVIAEKCPSLSHNSLNITP